jgi:hypothetical protein
MPFIFHPLRDESRDVTFDITMGYGLDGWDLIPARALTSVFDSFQTGSASHPAIYQMGTRGLFTGGKAA